MTVTSKVTLSVINEIKLSINVIIHEFSTKIIKTFTELVNAYFKLWIDQEFVELSEKNWMRISLKTNWEKKIKEKVKIYFLNMKNKTVIDETFDEFHKEKKLFWTTNATFFSFFCFVVWRDNFENKKERIVVDIRNLNAIIQSDAYSISFQFDIIQVVNDCFFIFVIDCSEFFYQWRVHFTKRHKFTVVTHRDQKSFNVAVMKFRNFSAYVQKQIDRILRSNKNFAKTYVNDIVIFSKSLNEHVLHFRKVFDILRSNNISIKSIKSFIDYFSMSLLEQRINSFDFVTNEQKLKAISKLVFSKTLKQLKTYLKLTEWFRDYIEKYAEKFKSLQKQKITLLKKTFLFD